MPIDIKTDENIKKENIREFVIISALSFINLKEREMFILFNWFCLYQEGT